MIGQKTLHFPARNSYYPQVGKKLLRYLLSPSLLFILIVADVHLLQTLFLVGIGQAITIFGLGHFKSFVQATTAAKKYKASKDNNNNSGFQDPLSWLKLPKNGNSNTSLLYSQRAIFGEIFLSWNGQASLDGQPASSIATKNREILRVLPGASSR